MTRITLLEQLKLFTEDCLRGLILPVQPQEEDAEPPESRPPAIYIPCLPEVRQYAQYAPFLTHEVVTSRDDTEEIRPGIRQRRSSTVVRTCICVYHDDQQEGNLALLNIIERLRIDLLEKVVIGEQFKLDVEAGVDTLVYPPNPNQSAVSPFYLGEMITTWKLPIIERKVPYGNQQVDYRGSGYPGRRG